VTVTYLSAYTSRVCWKATFPQTSKLYNHAGTLNSRWARKIESQKKLWRQHSNVHLQQLPCLLLKWNHYLQNKSKAQISHCRNQKKSEASLVSHSFLESFVFFFVCLLLQFDFSFVLSSATVPQATAKWDSAQISSRSYSGEWRYGVTGNGPKF